MPLGCGETGNDVVVYEVTVSDPDTGLSSVAGVAGSLEVMIIESFMLGEFCCHDDDEWWWWSWPVSQLARAVP